MQKILCNYCGKKYKVKNTRDCCPHCGAFNEFEFKKEVSNNKLNVSKIFVFLGALIVFFLAFLFIIGLLVDDNEGNEIIDEHDQLVSSIYNEIVTNGKEYKFNYSDDLINEPYAYLGMPEGGEYDYLVNVEVYGSFNDIYENVYKNIFVTQFSMINYNLSLDVEIPYKDGNLYFDNMMVNDSNGYLFYDIGFSNDSSSELESLKIELETNVSGTDERVSIDLVEYENVENYTNELSTFFNDMDYDHTLTSTTYGFYKYNKIYFIVDGEEYGFDLNYNDCMATIFYYGLKEENTEVNNPVVIEGDFKSDYVTHIDEGDFVFDYDDSILTNPSAFLGKPINTDENYNIDVKVSGSFDDIYENVYKNIHMYQYIATYYTMSLSLKVPFEGGYLYLDTIEGENFKEFTRYGIKGEISSSNLPNEIEINFIKNDNKYPLVSRNYDGSNVDTNVKDFFIERYPEGRTLQSNDYDLRKYDKIEIIIDGTSNIYDIDYKDCLGNIMYKGLKPRIFEDLDEVDYIEGMENDSRFCIGQSLGEFASTKTNSLCGNTLELLNVYKKLSAGQFLSIEYDIPIKTNFECKKGSIYINNFLLRLNCFGNYADGELFGGDNCEEKPSIVNMNLIDNNGKKYIVYAMNVDTEWEDKNISNSFGAEDNFGLNEILKTSNLNPTIIKQVEFIIDGESFIIDVDYSNSNSWLTYEVLK